MASNVLSNLIRWGVYLSLAFVVWKIVPVYAAALRFNFAVSEACRTGATARADLNEIQSDILFRARQLDLPVYPEDIELQRRNRTVRAHVAYVVPVELGPRELALNFHASARELPLFIVEDGEESFQMLRE